MDSYGDKFLSAPGDIDSKRDSHSKDNYSRPSGYGNGLEREGGSNINSIGSYDPYSSNKPLSEKIGVILDDVDKIKEGDNQEVIKQKVAQGGSKKLSNKTTNL
jgi:hypothetical protein